MHSNHGLRAFVPRVNNSDNHFARNTQELGALRFEVESKDHPCQGGLRLPRRLRLPAVRDAMDNPGFDVERDSEALLAFEADRLTEDGIAVTEWPTRLSLDNVSQANQAL